MGSSGMRTTVLLMIAVTAGLALAGCQQRRGPASPEAKDLIQGGPPVVSEGPAVDPAQDPIEMPEQAVQPQAQAQVQPTPAEQRPAPVVQSAPTPTPVAPVVPATRVASGAATVPATVPMPAE